MKSTSDPFLNTELWGILRDSNEQTLSEALTDGCHTSQELLPFSVSDSEDKHRHEPLPGIF